ncbi:hypothetical protein Brsp07_01441 [Brucella sp. NBRC 14130]
MFGSSLFYFSISARSELKNTYATMMIVGWRNADKLLVAARGDFGNRLFSHIPLLSYSLNPSS